jgi:hypothetical protein
MSANQFKNLQAAARRRGMSLWKEEISDEGSFVFCLYAKSDTYRREPTEEHFDLRALAKELRQYPLLNAKRKAVRR